MSSDDVAISVKNQIKTYRIFWHPENLIEQALTFVQMHSDESYSSLPRVQEHKISPMQKMVLL